MRTRESRPSTRSRPASMERMWARVMGAFRFERRRRSRRTKVGSRPARSLCRARLARSSGIVFVENEDSVRMVSWAKPALETRTRRRTRCGCSAVNFSATHPPIDTPITSASRRAIASMKSRTTAAWVATQ